jgi:hypothetical protein
MFNLYNVFDNPQTLPYYKELAPNMRMLKTLYDYADDGLTPEMLEPVIHLIARSPKLAMMYAIIVLDDRWPPGEPAIATSIEFSLDYIASALAGNPDWPYESGRWPAAEPHIMKDAETALAYVIQVLSEEPTWPHPNGRWPEAEPYIKKHEQAWQEYKNHVGLA